MFHSYFSLGWNGFGSNFTGWVGNGAENLPHEDLYYTPLLVENWPNFAGLWKTQFLMKMEMESTKDVKWEALQDGYLGFSKFWDFDP